MVAWLEGKLKPEPQSIKCRMTKDNWGSLQGRIRWTKGLIILELTESQKTKVRKKNKDQINPFLPYVCHIQTNKKRYTGAQVYGFRNHGMMKSKKELLHVT